jgi:hypothetical protein
MKIEKFELRDKNSLCAEAFQVIRGRAPAQLKRNIERQSNLITYKAFSGNKGK